MHKRNSHGKAEKDVHHRNHVMLDRYVKDYQRHEEMPCGSSSTTDASRRTKDQASVIASFEKSFKSRN